MKIGYGCCVGTWDKFHRYVEPRIYSERPIITASNQTSISVAYNAILDGFRVYDLDAVILLHDDLEMIDPQTEEKVLQAFWANTDAALVGVAGGGSSMSWWNVQPIGHQWTDSKLIDFGMRQGDVHMIEGSFMAFSPWAIQELRFDERYEFLGYDDVCLHAKAAGKRVIVADIDTHHHSTLGYKSESVRLMWERSEVIFNEKWKKE
jgi:Glycosyltransferase like family